MHFDVGESAEVSEDSNCIPWARSAWYKSLPGAKPAGRRGGGGELRCRQLARRKSAAAKLSVDRIATEASNAMVASRLPCRHSVDVCMKC